MTWLLKLYPPRWRRRYGAELADLISAQPFSFGTAMDLIAGAIDAWIYPQSSTATRKTTDSRGEKAMTNMFQLRCAGYVPDITAADKRKSVAVMIGGTLLLTLIWLWGVGQFKGNPYVEAMPVMAFILPYLIGLRFTQLKHRRGAVQAVFIGVNAAVAMAIMLGAAWLGTKI